MKSFLYNALCRLLAILIFIVIMLPIILFKKIIKKKRMEDNFKNTKLTETLAEKISTNTLEMMLVFSTSAMTTYEGLSEIHQNEFDDINPKFLKMYEKLVNDSKVIRRTLMKRNLTLN